MIKFLPSLAVSARFSVLQVSTKKSFKRLDQRPGDVFQYYLQLQVDRLNTYAEFQDLKKNIAFVKRIRGEWEGLSSSKKRVYHALFFKFNNIDYNKLSNEELARVLTIQSPTSSEYLLFRSKFKIQFNRAWEQRMKKITESRTSSNKRSKQLIYISTPNSDKIEKMLDFHARYQEMCRSCKKVWKENVTDEQKQMLSEKVNSMRREFDQKMVIERKELVLLTNALEKSVSEISYEPLSESLSVNNCQSKVLNDTFDSLRFLFTKKK